MPPRRSAAAQGLTESLADAVDRVDPPLDSFALSDPDAPGPAAVAAARARKPDAVPDPVSAIKADVRARLAPKAQAASCPGTAAALSHTPSAAASPVLQPPPEHRRAAVPRRRHLRPQRQSRRAEPAPPPLPTSRPIPVTRRSRPGPRRARGMPPPRSRECRPHPPRSLRPQATANFPAAVQEDK